MKNEFKKIGLWGRLSEDNVVGPALQISRHLKKRGLEVYAAKTARAKDGLAGVERIAVGSLAAKVDLLVAIGGDGNMLRAARCVAGHDVPLLGVNRGRLGFLTDISPEQMLDTIDAILAGDYLAEERQMLEATLIDEDGASHSTRALNDVVLQKGDSGRIIEFITTVDGSYVNTHGGDGLIVSTATGSTAYALSCGGPIIQPDVDAFVMIPICPHTLSDRPLLLRGSSRIEVQLEKGHDYFGHVACDGEELGRMNANASLQIRAAAERVRFLHPQDYNYYELLRSKLNWGRANRTGK